MKQDLIIHKISDEIKNVQSEYERLLHWHNTTIFYLCLHKLAHTFNVDFQNLHTKLCDKGLVDIYAESIAWDSSSNLFSVSNEGGLVDCDMRIIKSIDDFFLILQYARDAKNRYENMP